MTAAGSTHRKGLPVAYHNPLLPFPFCRGTVLDGHPSKCFTQRLLFGLLA